MSQRRSVEEGKVCSSDVRSDVHIGALCVQKLVQNLVQNLDSRYGIDEEAVQRDKAQGLASM